MPNTELYPLVLDLFPRGSAWRPSKDEGMEQYLDGKATNLQQPKDFLKSIAYVRSPLLTPFLSDLESEFGIIPSQLATELERRQNLLAQKTATGGQSPQYLQDRLTEAGFTNLQIHENRPPADPNIFLNSLFLCVCGNETSVCGNENAICGQTGGEVLVNGPLFTQSVDYISVCGNEVAVCGNENSICGRFDGINFIDRTYEIPTDPNLWGYFFFVGGDATRDSNGVLTEIETVNVDQSREEELKNIILKYKPVHTWAGLMINFS